MRAAPLVAGFLFIAAYAAGAEHELVVCRSGGPPSEKRDRWTRDVNSSLAGLSDSLATKGQPIALRTLPIDQCPGKMNVGCRSASGSIYCTDVALERVLFSLALLLQKTDRERWLGKPLDLLGSFPHTGSAALNVVDSVLFPEWWASFEGRWSSFAVTTAADSWRIAAEYLHQDPSSPAYERARDLVIWSIVGHETFHALGTCPISEPSFTETSGYLESVVAAQSQEFSCPNPPDNGELNADACGLRWIEVADRIPDRQAVDPTSRKVARAAAMLVLQAVFDTGLHVPPHYRSGWRANGYLYPHLRTAVTHRTLFHLGQGEPRVGLCRHALDWLWNEANESRFCVLGEDVQLIPDRTQLSPRLFPSVVTEAGWSCLDGSSTLPVGTHPLRGDDSVTIVVKDLKLEAPEQFLSFVRESAQQMIDRPHVHAALSGCMPRTQDTLRLDVHYKHDGILDEVRGDLSHEVRHCMEMSLKALKFGDSRNSAFIDPDKPYTEPGFTMILALRRNPR